MGDYVNAVLWCKLFALNRDYGENQYLFFNERPNSAYTVMLDYRTWLYDNEK